MAEERDLLFGLLALQNGLIDQGQLVTAFQAWVRDRSRPLAEHLAVRGDLDPDDRSAIEALVVRHLKKHAGDVEQSLAAVPVGRATREQLAALCDPELTGAVAQLRSGSTEPDAEHTVTYSVGTATSDGQRFRVLRPHARGGLGAVFVALDAELHREVAIKQILDRHADDPDSRRRFLLEAEITGGLEHPGIVPVYGLGTYGDGRPYYAMRFVKGESLKEAIQHFHNDASLKLRSGRRSLELRKLLRRFTDVCNAIGYAHARGVLHRDIKPGNVIVGRHGETLVVDWGLAKAIGEAEPSPLTEDRPLRALSTSGSSETLPGAALGTPAYMSPEQAAGDLDRLGLTSDVYGLGATLYNLLTGKPPFEGDDPGAILRRVRAGEYPPPRQIDATIDRALETVCLKAMALKPEDRYASCRALADDVERWMADEPVSSWREPLSRRASRWARRHRPLVAGGTALLISAVLGLSIGALLINRERAKADANFRQARAAVDEYFTTVSESKLLDVPGLQPLRKELLDAARKYYREFLDRHGDDRNVRAEAAAASFRIGWINLAIGQPSEALEPLQNATVMYDGLTRAHPGEIAYRRLAAMAHGSMGLLYSRLDRPDEALAAHLQALELRESIARSAPNDIVAQSDLARSYRNIGDLQRGVGKLKETLTQWEKAIAVGRKLLRGPIPHDAGGSDLTGRRDLSTIVREDLAGVLLDLASVLREVGRLDESRASWQQSRELLETLATEQPANQAVRRRLAGAYLDDALLQIDRGRFDEARAALRRGLGILDGLAAANPSVVGCRVLQAEGQLRLGWTLRQLGHAPESLVAYEKGTAIAESLAANEPGSAEMQSLHAQCLTQQGNLLLRQDRASDARPKLQRALEIHEKLARAHPNSISHRSALTTARRGVGRAEAASGEPAAASSAFERAAEIDRSLASYPGCRYNLACSLALLVPVSPPDRREALACQAVEALRQAQAAGYSNVVSINTDSDLDSLRNRPDFQSLLAKLASTVDPFTQRD